MDTKIKKNRISKRKESERNRLVNSAGSITLLRIIAKEVYRKNPFEDVSAPGN